MTFNIFNNQGALDEGREFRSAINVGADEKMRQLNSMMPFTPQDERERVFMERTMIPVGQNEMGVPQFITPERAVAQQNEAKIQALQAKADADFEKKVGNPLFKAGDFLADLARNTIGAPINFLTDGKGFQLDPSKSTVEGYKSRLKELDDLRTLNQNLFYTGRDTRATAFAGAVSKRLDNKVSGAPRLNNKGQWVQAYEDGSSKVITNTQGEPVRALDKSKIHFVGGVPHKYDPVTQTMTPSVDANEAFELMQQEAYTKSYGKAQQVYLSDRPSMATAVAKTKDQFNNRLRTAIDGARKFISDKQASGWNGLFSALPESDARVLANYLTTISANVSFAELQDMRASNKNGAALGNVTELELKMLAAVQGSLDRLSTGEQLLESLDVIETGGSQMITRLERKLMELDEYYQYQAPEVPQIENDPEIKAMDELMGF